MTSKAPGPLVGTPLVRRLSAVHANHKRIAAGALLIGALTVFAKLFVAGREMAIAGRYGVGSTIDAYQLALTITTWLPMMLTSVMTVVLVPRLVALRDDSPARRQFVAELNGTVLLIGIAIVALTFAAAPAASLLLASRLDPETLELTTTMSRQMSLVALFAISVGYLSARLQSRERFTYSVTEAVPALVIALLVVGVLPIEGTGPLVWGALAGFFLQALLLSAMVERGDLGFGSFSLRHRSPEWHSLYVSVAVMAIAQAVLAFSIPIDQAFAARLGSGAIATLGYANRIIVLFTGFGAAVLARALLPVLSRTMVEGKHQLGSRQARQWAGLLFVFGGTVSIAIWVFAEWGVSLLFQRGAFTEADTKSVAHVLQFGAIQLPFYFAGLSLVQWMAANNRFPYILLITSCALAAKVVGNGVMAPMFGLEGIMLSTALMYSVTLALLAIGIGRPTRRGSSSDSAAQI